MIKNLSYDQLLRLLSDVFALGPNERTLTILVDLPNERVPDNKFWADRRLIAAEWYSSLTSDVSRIPFSDVMLCAYENVGSNNNDLPEYVYQVTADELRCAKTNTGNKVSLHETLRNSSVVLAPTQLSATAPLKILARSLMFRGATLPGFLRGMIPTLALDYEKIHARVVEFKQRMDEAETVTVTLAVNGMQYVSEYDLRYRTGHASGGLMREPGIVGNLPSGEAYIVPYEGELAGEISRTKGLLPVQFSDEIVLFRIEENRAVEVLSSGIESDKQRSKLLDDPAYGNIAEVGIGVLGEWGVVAIGSTLLDEKLGVHIAFGRSDHFGGITSPKSFKSSENVIHIDWVYVPSLQPLISVGNVTFTYPGGKSETILRDGKYVI